MIIWAYHAQHASVLTMWDRLTYMQQISSKYIQYLGDLAHDLANPECQKLMHMKNGVAFL